MTDIVKLIGAELVKPEGREMTYEALTQKFDGRNPSANMLADLVYFYNMTLDDMRGRVAPGQPTEPNAEEIRKLAFLFRLAAALRKMGLTSTDLKRLEEATWLVNR